MSNLNKICIHKNKNILSPIMLNQYKSSERLYSCTLTFLKLENVEQRGNILYVKKVRI